MINNNAKLLFCPTLKNGNVPAREFKNISGTTSTCTGGSQQASMIQGIKIVVGNGTILPTVDDYVLESPINTITQNVVSATKYNDLNNLTWNNVSTILFCTSILTNDTEEDITITEVGIQCNFSPTEILMCREVLEQPYTLEAGHSVQFRVSIK